MVAVALAAAYFPLLFDHFQVYDDEGYLLTSLRSFLDQGGLYEDTYSQYGPFYYLVFAPIFWLTGKQPTHDIGRLLVLCITSVTGAVFGAAVWRVTRSLPWSLLCQVGAFLLLVSRAGDEPMHPGSLIALLLAIVTFALASYSTSQRASGLVVAGAPAARCS